MEVTSRISALLRESDSAGRLGGDEFAVLLEGVEPSDAVEPARRIIAAVAEPMTVAGQEVRVGVSIGIAGGVAGRLDADELLAAADASMYVAKRSGSGRVVVDGDLLATA